MPNTYRVHKILMIGFGAIAQATLPLLRMSFPSKDTTIHAIDPVTPCDLDVFRNKYDLQFTELGITRENLHETLPALLTDVSVVINLSTDVSSVELLALAQEQGIIYIDTCIEPWSGFYVDSSIEYRKRTNYELREQLLSYRKEHSKPTTAVIAHGANPGLVSHFVKKALLDVASDLEYPIEVPNSRRGWAELAHALGIKAIHIAEHDTQISHKARKADEFINTWSVNGLLSEGLQPAELGWGTHEEDIPDLIETHPSGCGAAAYISKPGASIQVKTWVPSVGECIGYLITHNESISIADYLSIQDESSVLYRPTVHYAYRPCQSTLESIDSWSKNLWAEPGAKRVLKAEEVESGADYLGVLLMGHENNAYWYGSILDVDTAKELAPFNTATTLQVAAGVYSGVLWAINNPEEGIVEAEELAYDEVLAIAEPFLGDMKGFYTDWKPNEASSAANAWTIGNFLK